MSGMAFEARNELFNHRVNSLFFFYPTISLADGLRSYILVLLMNTKIGILWHVRQRAYYPG